MTTPNFDGIYGATANPLRQNFMTGAVWRWAKNQPQFTLNILESGSSSGASALAWRGSL